MSQEGFKQQLMEKLAHPDHPLSQKYEIDASSIHVGCKFTHHPIYLLPFVPLWAQLYLSLTSHPL